MDRLLWRAEGDWAGSLGGGRVGTHPAGAIYKGTMRQVGERGVRTHWWPLFMTCDGGLGCRSGASHKAGVDEASR